LVPQKQTSSWNGVNKLQKRIVLQVGRVQREKKKATKNYNNTYYECTFWSVNRLDHVPAADVCLEQCKQAETCLLRRHAHVVVPSLIFLYILVFMA
jgi:hypothetical protein